MMMIVIISVIFITASLFFMSHSGKMKVTINVIYSNCSKSVDIEDILWALMFIYLDT